MELGHSSPVIQSSLTLASGTFSTKAALLGFVLHTLGQAAVNQRSGTVERAPPLITMVDVSRRIHLTQRSFAINSATS